MSCFKNFINCILASIFLIGIPIIVNATSAANTIDSFFKENLCYSQDNGFSFPKHRKVVVKFVYPKTDQFETYYKNDTWVSIFKIYSDEITKLPTDIDSLATITAYNCVHKKWYFFNKKSRINIIGLPHYEYKGYTYVRYEIQYKGYSMSIMIKAKENDIVRVCYISGIS